MILKLKNKHILGLSKILQKGYQLGGVPKYFEVHPSEAYHMLIEINELYQTRTPIEKGGPLEYIDIVQVSDTTEDVRLALYSKSSITRELGEELVKQWHAKEFYITYSGIEVRVIPNAKVSKSKPLPVLPRD
jgi:hypothetical protein